MLEHLLELRRRALSLLLWFGGLFTLCFLKANTLFHYLTLPLSKALPEHSKLIATQITAPLFTPLQLSFNLALLGAAPIALYQIWQFVAPGLYQQEKKPLLAGILFSLILFLLGLAFCFFFILPFMFHFFSQSTPVGVRYLPDIASALNFITHMLLVFGLCFQVPLVVMVLVKSGLLAHQTLVHLRPYVIVSAFIIGMLLTPPDVLSQIMLAIPLCLLFELGVFLSRWVQN